MKDEKFVRKIYGRGSKLLVVTDILPLGWTDVVINRKVQNDEYGRPKAITLEIRPIE